MVKVGILSRFWILAEMHPAFPHLGKDLSFNVLTMFKSVLFVPKLLKVFIMDYDISCEEIEE